MTDKHTLPEVRGARVYTCASAPKSRTLRGRRRSSLEQGRPAIMSLLCTGRRPRVRGSTAPNCCV
jgi:hypothetical protein